MMKQNDNTILDELLAPERPEEFDENKMGLLAEAVNELIIKQDQIAKAEETLKQLKAEERAINQGTIPQMMSNLGFERITLKDGRTLSVKDSIQCGITAANRPAAYAWMDKHGHDGLIKANINIKFSRDERKTAEAIQADLRKRGISATLTESVHPGTLKAWARAELEQGHSLPAELFNVHVVKITTVK